MCEQVKREIVIETIDASKTGQSWNKSPGCDVILMSGYTSDLNIFVNKDELNIDLTL